MTQAHCVSLKFTVNPDLYLKDIIIQNYYYPIIANLLNFACIIMLSCNKMFSHIFLPCRKAPIQGEHTPQQVA